MTFPILDYDPARVALIEPSAVIQPRDVPESCVICFFRDVLDQVITDHAARPLAAPIWEDGPHPIYEITYQGRRLAFFHPGIGAPLAAGLLEDAIGLGCRKFMVAGGCGVLEKGMAVGAPVVVTHAVRDEGVSYHYLPPGREVATHPAALQALEHALAQRGLAYRLGKTWTTDAPYRETPALIARRRAEGCSVVEMECAGLLAVAQFRNVPLGQILYGGDDLSGTAWDHRNWQSHQSVREQLFWLAADASLLL